MDRLTLHVTNNVYQMFLDGRKTIEYRPLNAFYFPRLDRFRLMFERNKSYCMELVLYKAYSKEKLSLTIFDLKIVPWSMISERNRKLLCKIYGDEVQNMHFYALYTL